LNEKAGDTRSILYAKNPYTISDPHTLSFSVIAKPAASIEVKAEDS